MIDPLVRQLVAARVRAGLSQRAVARKTGIGQNHICQWEGGRHTPAVPTLRRWAAGLGLELTFIPAKITTGGPDDREPCPAVEDDLTACGRPMPCPHHETIGELPGRDEAAAGRRVDVGAKLAELKQRIGPGCPAHGVHPHAGMECLDCAECTR